MIELFVSGSVDPTENLAIEEWLTYHYDSKNAILFLWQNQNTIVVGRNQNIYDQIIFDNVEQDNVDVVPRNTGGGTVFHDFGNICYSIIGLNDPAQKFSIGTILQPV